MTRPLNFVVLMFLLLCLLGCGNHPNSHFEIALNGLWQMGFNRQYDTTVTVPGIQANPTIFTPDTLWFKRKFTWPNHKNNQTAQLVLRGARFNPVVYINGKKAGQAKGGLAQIDINLSPKLIQPGKQATIEIALTPLNHLATTNASRIPEADWWRSNVGSCLWDDVLLRMGGQYVIEKAGHRFMPNSKKVKIHYTLSGQGGLPERIECRLLSPNGELLFKTNKQPRTLSDTIAFALPKQVTLWSPNNPACYTIELLTIENNNKASVYAYQTGFKHFEVKQKKFYLNNKPVTLRAASVVWHRWCRDPNGRLLAHDTAWWRQHVIAPMKARGANTLRFHLGNPPDFLLTMCDQEGLMVQYEWIFFHGMKASQNSLLAQWPAWLQQGNRHPSTVIVHPYNETEGKQLETVWKALDSLLPAYSGFAVKDRHVTHIHKYWWSLFENVGLYYDSYQQFDKAIMADEFGGNYLDGRGQLGGYSTLPESFLRFLGPKHTVPQRLWHQAKANGRIAEYWRQIGAAGFSPFCVAGSWEDGNHWYLGHPAQGKLKPVWDAMTPAWSPIAASLQLWNNHYLPKQKISIPVMLFNETGSNQTVNYSLNIIDSTGQQLQSHPLSQTLPSHQPQLIKTEFTMPAQPGEYTIVAKVTSPVQGVSVPIESNWQVWVHQPQLNHPPDSLVVGYYPQIEPYWPQVFAGLPIRLHPMVAGQPLPKELTAIVAQQPIWQQLQKNDSWLSHLEQAIEQGIHVLLLNVGPQDLGQGYPKKQDLLGPLEQAPLAQNRKPQHQQLPGGAGAVFTAAAEPESHLHPTEAGLPLWGSKPPRFHWLWNGLRGGLTVPAWHMTLEGLSQPALLQQWQQRGADTALITQGNYYVYALQGFYAYSRQPNHKITKDSLRAKVKFLVEDAPALKGAVNPNAPIEQINLHQKWQQAKQAKAQKLTPLVVAGKNLSRSPVVVLDYGTGKGRLLVSQLITQGRLNPNNVNQGLYKKTYDPAAAQWVLNALSYLSQTLPSH